MRDAAEAVVTGSVFRHLRQRSLRQPEDIAQIKYRDDLVSERKWTARSRPRSARAGRRLRDLA